MRNGEMRHRLRLQDYRYAGQDPMTGEVRYDWVDVATVYAKVEGVQGREFLAASAEQAGTTWRIVTRYLADIKTTFRLLDGATVFNIKAILPDNKLRRTVLMCESGVTQR